MSGVLSLLMGAGSFLVALSSPVSITDTTADPGTASTDYGLRTNGDIVKITGTGGTVVLGKWVTPPGFNPALWEVRFSQVSGDAIGGVGASWLNLGTNRDISLNNTTAGIPSSKSGVALVEIRPAGGGSTLTSATVTLTATTT
jgi:hypothetical protein